MGFANLLVVAVAAVLSIRRRPTLTLPWLLIGCFALVLSLGFPFDQERWFYEHAGPLKEFRTLGRFSWLAVAGIMVWAYVTVFSRIPNTRLRNAVALVLLAACFWESSDYRAQVLSQFEPSTSIVEDVDHALSDYQGPASAVIPYPMVYIGCDHFSPPKDDKFLVVQALKTSCALGMPTLTNSGSRQNPTRTRIVCSASSELGPDSALVSGLAQVSHVLVVARFWDIKKLQQMPGAIQVGEGQGWVYFEFPTAAYLQAHTDPALQKRVAEMEEVGLTLEWKRPRFYFPETPVFDQSGDVEILVAHCATSPNPLSGNFALECKKTEEKLGGLAFTESIGMRGDGYQINRLVVHLDSADVPARLFYTFDPQYPGPIVFLRPSVSYLNTLPLEADVLN